MRSIRKLIFLSIFYLFILHMCCCSRLFGYGPTREYTIQIDISGYVYDEQDTTAIPNVLIEGYYDADDVAVLYRELTTTDSSGYYRYQGPLVMRRLKEDGRPDWISIQASKEGYHEKESPIWGSDTLKWTREAQVYDFYLRKRPWDSRTIPH